MIKVLLVEDNGAKTQEICAELLAHPEVGENGFKACGSVFDARVLLRAERFDLLILDLVLPARLGREPMSGQGLALLEEIRGSNGLYPPAHIICCTEYDEEFKKVEIELRSRLVHLVRYGPFQEEWKVQLSNKLFILGQINNESSLDAVPKFDYDVAVVTSSPLAELKAVLRWDASFTETFHERDSMIYYKGVLHNRSGKAIRVVAFAAPQMGMAAAAVTICKAITTFRPRVLGVCGIAAGVRGAVEYGDITLATECFDYGSGKITTEENGDSGFLPDPRHLAVSSRSGALIQMLERKQSFVADISAVWEGAKPQSVLKAVSGVVTSGAAVVGHEKIMADLRTRSRKLVALDMEAYGAFYACAHSPKPQPELFVCKSISDFGDTQKDDRFHGYAAHTSAQWMRALISELLFS